MSLDRTARRRPVNITLNEDLPCRARAAERDRQIDAHIAASDAFVAKYGFFADEFIGL